MSKHKALELAEKLRARNGNAAGFGLGPVCDEAADTIRAQHALIVQMQAGMKSAAKGMAEVLLELAGAQSTPENIEMVKGKVQPCTPFGDLLAAIAAADQYLKGEQA